MATDYYSILGLSKNATPEEIVSAVRELSMKHHPDKGGNPDIMKAVTQANKMLNNPNMRRLYDYFGADVMKVYEIMGSGFLDDMKGTFRGLVFLILIFGPLATAQLIFIPMALEGDVDWSATTTLIPLFILDGLIGIFNCAVTINLLKTFRGGSGGLGKYALAFIMLRMNSGVAANIAFHALVAMKIDNDDNSWLIVFSPFIAFYTIETIGVTVKTFIAVQTFNRAAKEIGMPTMTFLKIGKLILENITFNSSLHAFFILIALKKDDYLDLPWYMIFIPLWVMFGVAFLFSLHKILTGNHSGLISTLCRASFQTAPWFVFLGMLAAKSEGGDYTWHEVFAPLYAGLGLIHCVSLCAVSLARKAASLEVRRPEMQ